MKKYKENVRRLCAVLLALMMCVTFMPAGVFAEGEPDAQGGEEIVLDQPQETVDEEPVQGTGTVDPEQPEEDPQAEPAEDQKTEYLTIVLFSSYNLVCAAGEIAVPCTCNPLQQG